MNILNTKLFLALVSILLIPVTLHSYIYTESSNGEAYVAIYDTIIIYPDGKVYPVDAPVATSDNRTYYLTEDVKVLNSVGLIIARDDIVIDGNNHSLSASITGVEIIGVENVTIRNIKIYAPTYAILVRDSYNISIRGAIFTTTREEYLEVSSGPVFINNSYNVLLENNTFQRRWSSGVDGSLGVLITHSRDVGIKANRFQKSLYITSSFNCTVTGNSFKYSDIYVAYSENTVISSNEVEALLKGISLYYSRSINVSNNTVLYGLINVSYSDNISILYNSVAGAGIIIDQYTLVYGNIVLEGNTVNDKPAIMIRGERGIVVDEFGQLYIVNSTNVVAESSVINYTVNPVTVVNSYNVTIRGLSITGCKVGFYVHGVNVKIYDNYVSKCYIGINIHGYNIHVYNNKFSDITGIGVRIERYGYNVLDNNTFINTLYGVVFIDTMNNTVEDGIYYRSKTGLKMYRSRYNNIVGNYFISCNTGISIENSSSNTFYHNTFLSNTVHVEIKPVNGTVNKWSCGYPCGGNFWDDYQGVDRMSGVYQNVSGEDGIGDKPYVINELNIDPYPLIKPLHDLSSLAITLPRKILIIDSHIVFDNETGTPYIKYQLVFIGYTGSWVVVIDVSIGETTYELSEYIDIDKPFSIVEKLHRLSISENGTYSVRWVLKIYYRRILYSERSFNETIHVALIHGKPSGSTGPGYSYVIPIQQTIIRGGASTTSIVNATSTADETLLLGIAISIIAVSVVVIILSFKRR